MAFTNLKIFTFLICFLDVSLIILTFNIDTKAPLVKRGPSGSFFGFSLAFHKIENSQSQSQEMVFLVGAPKGNITHATVHPDFKKISQPGLLFKCKLETDPQCQELVLEKKYDAGDEEKYKDMWIGVSIGNRLTDKESQVIVCGHRYKDTTGGIWGNGQCIQLNNALSKESYLNPCNSQSKSHDGYGYCQAGTSVHVSDNDVVLMGLPGPIHWKGFIVRKQVDRESNFENNIHIDPDDYFSKERKMDDITNVTNLYSYLGMSVHSGHISSDPTKLTFIAGAPRSEHIGQVICFTGDKHMNFEFNLTGDQFGSYFGHELVVMDINNDGREDLIVSAPFYRDHGISGAIYVYMNKQGITSRTKPMKITGRKMKDKECLLLNCIDSRFGYAMSYAGDLNGDGFNDLIVGAPYEGNGAVYIFHGRADGLDPDPVQRIYADNLGTTYKGLSFGASLAGSGADLDGNGYPDILIGSFMTGSAYVLFSRPVVDIQYKFENIPNIIDPTVKQCPIDGSPRNCFQLRLCFKVLPSNVRKNTIASVNINYTVEAEIFAGVARPRVSFDKDNNNKDTYNGQIVVTTEETCKELMAYLKNTVRDFLNPIMVQLSFNIFEKPGPTVESAPGKSLPNYNDYPILNGVMSKQVLNVNFKKNCGPDDVCSSDLTLDVSLNLNKSPESNYILRIGQDGEIEVEVSVENLQEDAHETNLYITLPSRIEYIGTKGQDEEVSCNKFEDDSNIVVCTVGNPFPQGGKADFVVRLDPRLAMPSRDVVDLKLKVNTTSQEINPTNNELTLKMEVVVETDLGIRGSSEPESVFYGGEVKGESIIKYEEEIGSEVKHSYEIKNIGKAHVPKSTVFISWPIELHNKHHEHGKHLLYLIDEPMLEGDGECFFDMKMINPLKLKKAAPELAESKQQNQNTENSPGIHGNDPSSSSTNRMKRDSSRAVSKRAAFFSSENIVKLDCDLGTARCYKFNCTLGELRPGQSIVVRLRSRLWNSTFIEDFPKRDAVEIYSKAEIFIDPSLNIRQANTNNDVLKMMTSAKPEMKESEGVAWWIILISVLIGVLLLVGLILLLWKCGFFKRTKRSQIATHKAQMQKRPLSEMED